MSAQTVSEKAYVLVLGALLLLTYATYAAALVNLGRWNLAIALGIAAAKAALIILYFMHARYSRWLTWVVIVAGLFWFGILLVLTMSDYLTRGW